MSLIVVEELFDCDSNDPKIKNISIPNEKTYSCIEKHIKIKFFNKDYKIIDGYLSNINKCMQINQEYYEDKCFRIKRLINSFFFIES